MPRCANQTAHSAFWHGTTGALLQRFRSLAAASLKLLSAQMAVTTLKAARCDSATQHTSTHLTNHLRIALAAASAQRTSSDGAGRGR